MNYRRVTQITITSIQQYRWGCESCRRHKLLTSGQKMDSFSPSEYPPSMQVSALITGVRQHEDTFRIAIRFWRLTQYFGSGRRRRKCGTTTYPATSIMTDICGQGYRLPNRVRMYGLIFGVQIAVTNSTHGLSVCWYLLYKA